jgi:hypothetical protein
MLTVRDFIDTEGSSSYLIKYLLESIENLKKDNIEEKVLSFDVYDVTTNTKINEVIISENLFFDNTESIKLTINDFCAELLKSVA